MGALVPHERTMLNLYNKEALLPWSPVLGGIQSDPYHLMDNGGRWL